MMQSHTFTAEIPHHEFETLVAEAEYNQIEQCATVSVYINNGRIQRITLTIDELRALGAFAERFEQAHKHMIGE